MTQSLLARIECGYDAFPRRPDVRAEAVGPFELFVREGPGHQYYARPRLGTVDVTPADVDAVLARQRELGVPEAIEWVPDITPAVLPAIGHRLRVVHAPLMVLDPALLPPSAGDSGVNLLDPAAADFAELHSVSAAVAHVGFTHGGTAAGGQGTVERDTAVSPPAPQRLPALAAAILAGEVAEAVVVDPVEGMVARGAYQAALGVAEIVGVATLPSARRRGHGAAVTATLARHAMAHGNDLVFLSAADEAVANVYARIGFRRIGTAGIAEH